MTDKLERMFALLRDRCADAEAKKAAMRETLDAHDPKALAAFDALKKTSTPVLPGSGSKVRNSAHGDFRTFAGYAAKDE